MLTDQPEVREDHIRTLWEEGQWEALIPLTWMRHNAAQQARDNLAQAESLCELTLLLMVSGRSADAVAVSRQEVAVRRILGDPSLIATALSSLANALENAGHWKAALIRYRQSLAIWVSLAELEEIGDTWTEIGLMLLDRGRYRGALRAFQSTLDLASEEKRGFVLDNMAKVHKASGDLPAALARKFQSVQAIYQQGGEWVEGQVELAYLYLEGQKSWEGREMVRDAVEVLRSTGRLDQAQSLQEQARRVIFDRDRQYKVRLAKKDLGRSH